MTYALTHQTATLPVRDDTCPPMPQRSASAWAALQYQPTHPFLKEAFSVLRLSEAALICTPHPDDLWPVLMMALLANRQSALIVLPDTLTLQRLYQRLSHYALPILQPVVCLAGQSIALQKRACQAWTGGQSQLMLTTVEAVTSPDVFGALRQRPPARWIITHGENLLPKALWPQACKTLAQQYARLARLCRTHADSMSLLKSLICLAPPLPVPVQDALCGQLGLPPFTTNVLSLAANINDALPGDLSIELFNVKTQAEQYRAFWQSFQSVQGRGGISWWLMTTPTRAQAHQLAQSLSHRLTRGHAVWVATDVDSTQEALHYYEDQSFNGPRLLVMSQADTPAVIAAFRDGLSRGKVSIETQNPAQTPLSWVLWDAPPSMPWLKAQMLALWHPGVRQKALHTTTSPILEPRLQQLIVLHRPERVEITPELAIFLQEDHCHHASLRGQKLSPPEASCGRCRACRIADQNANRWWRRKITQLFG